MSARLWKTAVISGMLSVLAAVLLFMAAIVWSLKAEQPDRCVGIFVLIILWIGAALSGFLAGKLYADGPLLASVVAGCIYTAFFCFVSLPFGSGFMLSGFLCKAVLPIFLAGSVGFFLKSKGTTRYGNRRKAARHAGKIYKGKRS